jgi:hypothetical protein
LYDKEKDVQDEIEAETDKEHEHEVGMEEDVFEESGNEEVSDVSECQSGTSTVNNQDDELPPVIPQFQEEVPRRSTRTTKGLPPYKYVLKVNPKEIKEPRNLHEVLKSSFRKE